MKLVEWRQRYTYNSNMTNASQEIVLIKTLNMSRLVNAICYEDG